MDGKLGGWAATQKRFFDEKVLHNVAMDPPDTSRFSQAVECVMYLPCMAPLNVVTQNVVMYTMNSYHQVCASMPSTTPVCIVTPHQCYA